MLKGCDISKHQGSVDFDKLKNTVDFVVIRASYGSGYIDSEFDNNKDGARKAGMLRGYYHYAYPTLNSPEAEANWFCSVVSDLQEGEFLALDFEETYSDPIGWSLRFLNVVASKFINYKPFIYINLNFNNMYNWKPVVDAGYPIWLARWDYNSSASPPQTDWTNVYLRQYSNSENISGISGVADGNVFYGERDYLINFGYRPPQTTDQADKARAVQVLLDYNAKLAAPYGNIEATARGLIGIYYDYINLIEDSKDNEKACNVRVVEAISTTKSELNTVWQSKLDSANNIIGKLRKNQASELPWRELFSIAWKKFWASKKGGDSA